MPCGRVPMYDVRPEVLASMMDQLADPGSVDLVAEPREGVDFRLIRGRRWLPFGVPSGSERFASSSPRRRAQRNPRGPLGVAARPVGGAAPRVGDHRGPLPGRPVVQADAAADAARWATGDVGHL